mmetsp:Transcript_20425/g.24747  ORF Transcript_20425/g.24747 Transcript_20425/m.24747 type:complete len:278 (-) Transcript_20425:143-976(-)|eukprot:CAMPEP_0204828494 /NCGR_PEP_ID=MMETSP1346-20131115/6295_1 /ASSEMBLY_ACC=CAM_ASM_000771 /TAXON_ID=215587 /ORGANISM="Aplanochytrium stocchinoi, Strain GSBS06" /LENGTH=277 /DNA_ID=CAMNT_0051957613 /DNA_START=106 /DNA_END=939 /DNA_ORIENTATION=+
MGAEKRSRDQFQETSNRDAATVAALLGLGGEGETVPMKKLKLVGNIKDEPVSVAVQSLPLAHRQIIFNLAFNTSSQVLNSMVSCAIKAGYGTGNQAAKVEIVVRQVTALQSLFAIVVAEIAQLCNIVPIHQRKMGFKKARVLSEEIKRLRSTRFVVDLLNILVTRVDSVNSTAGLSIIIGSVKDSLSKTFKEMKAEINQMRKPNVDQKEADLDGMKQILSKIPGAVIPQGLLNYVSPLTAIQNPLMNTTDKDCITTASKFPTAAEMISQACSAPISA